MALLSAASPPHTTVHLLVVTHSVHLASLPCVWAQQGMSDEGDRTRVFLLLTHCSAFRQSCCGCSRQNRAESRVLFCRFWKRIGPTVHAKDVEARVAQRTSVTPGGVAPLDSVTLPPKATTY